MSNINEERLNRDLSETQKLLLRSNPTVTLIERLTGSNVFENTGYDRLYTFGTEDMRTYSKEFSGANSFLSICASGDQILNAVLTGATEIDAFDSNNLCGRALNLKIAALKGLSRDEFLEYYETFSPYLFVKFAELLDEEDLFYWVTIYRMFPENQAGMLIRDFLFGYKKLDESMIILINPYLEKKNYNRLRSMLDDSKINFIHSDLFSLPEHIGDKKYDAMNFSNIYEYINYGKNTGTELASKYYNFMMDEMYTRLNDSGKMLIAYTYAFSDSVKKDFLRYLKENDGKVTYPGALSLDEYEKYLRGLTTQNLSYAQLYDLLGSRDEEISKLRTNHIQYGQSTDMSADTAVFIKRR